MKSDDFRYEPLYPIAHVARYLKMNVGTLRTWVRGRYYPVKKGQAKQYFAPLLWPPDDSGMLSFINLVEVHVLKAFRFEHCIRMEKIRITLEEIGAYSESKHPLAEQDFQTDKVDIFIDSLGTRINLSRRGQIEMKDVVDRYLHRIERDDEGLAARFYPFTRQHSQDKRLIVIDPAVSFGRPTLTGTGVSTAIIAERWEAGDPPSVLQEDYSLDAEQIDEALWYEKTAKTAA